MAVNFGEAERKRGELDMAPLIDVVFLLLVFFLLTSSYVFKAFDLKMPSKGQIKPDDSDNLKPVTIQLQEDNTVMFDGVPVDLRDLGRNVYAHLPASGKRTFVIKPQDTDGDDLEEVEVQLLINVMERVRAAGATDVRMARPDSKGDGDGNQGGENQGAFLLELQEDSSGD